MKKETLELLKEYISSTIKTGISKESFDILSTLLCVDRTFALELHNLISTVQSIDGKYTIDENI